MYRLTSSFLSLPEALFVLLNPPFNYEPISTCVFAALWHAFALREGSAGRSLWGYAAMATGLSMIMCLACRWEGLVGLATAVLRFAGHGG